MPIVALLNQTGEKLQDITLDDSVFGIEPNQQVIFDAVVMQRASMRQGTHDVKNRREVRGGGRKPYRQKGTGNARQGSIRAPQYRGGGIVFGPTPRSYATKLNRKVRRLALKSVLSEKVLANSMIVVDAMTMAAPKTKDMVAPRTVGQAGFPVLNDFFADIYGKEIETKDDIISKVHKQFMVCCKVWFTFTAI